MNDDNQPCGENDCYCRSAGPEHADCACGCDCPRCPDCQQLDDYCDCED
ncbi:hypothetical protein [Streptomyces sp. WM4235]|nr:hypothetical protein [Streptomyces sp. WM4235]